MILTHYNSGGSLAGTPTAVGGYVGVKQMQEQLRRIAFETSKVKLDPAQYDGKVTMSTIIALANAAPVVGKAIHPVVGNALSVVDLIKAPIKKIPYGDTVIEFVLSPWIIDEIYGAILGIIRLIPGGGGVASAIDKAMKAVKEALAGAAGPIAAALALFHPKKSGFGAITNRFIDTSILNNVAANAMAIPSLMTTVPDSNAGANPPPGFTWIDVPPVPGHWERARVGRPPMPGPGPATIEIRTHPPGAPTKLFNAPKPLPPPQPGQPGVIRSHQEWPRGKEIVSADWGRAKTYYGLAKKRNLGARDLANWEKYKNNSAAAIGRPDISVRNGVIAFQVFQGFDKSRMGAFWDERTQMLKITGVPAPSSGGPLDFVSDAVSSVADAVGDAVGAAAGAIADIAQDTWNWIAENADDVYNAIKKYGCAIVNNDIVVGITAAGAGIVASPAASAAVITGAQAGKAGCAVLEVAEALYAIYKLLSMDFPKPVPLNSPNPPLMTVAASFLNTGLMKAVLTLQPPVVPLAKSRYPDGAIAAFDEKIQRYRIAIPVGTKFVPLSNGLGATAPFGADASHFEVDQADKAPIKVPVVPIAAFQQQTATLPITKKPLFWAAIGAGVLVVGAGAGYALYRRRRRLASGNGYALYQRRRRLTR